MNAVGEGNPVIVDGEHLARQGMVRGCLKKKDFVFTAKFMAQF